MRSLILSLTLAALTGPLAAQEAGPAIGDDGLHKAPWLHDTFKDLREDLAEANAGGQRLVILIEQRGCIYCKKMHEEVFVDPEIERMLEQDYFAVQINMFGDVEVTDFDGTTLSEKEMVARWNAIFTPTLMFLPEEVQDGQSAAEAAVVTMPGAFGRNTTLNLFTWVRDHGYDGEKPFQKYHARMLEEQVAE